MAWLQKRGGIYWIGWRLNGKQYRQSTKLTVETEALKVLKAHEQREAVRAADALTQSYIEAATGKKIERATASKFFDGWLRESEAETTRSTMNKYRQVVREFKEYIEADSKGLMLDDITVEQVAGFLTEKRTQLAAGTVKGYRRILGSIFLLAHNSGAIKRNLVALAKVRGRAAQNETTRKRPFTLAEIKTLFDSAKPFWKYMIVAGYFTGQSLGDLATLRAENVSLSTGLITMHRRKTGKQVIIPISKPLRAALKSIWPKGGKGYFWPDEAARYLKVGASPFSQEFYELMATAGLVTAREDKQSKGKGRDTKREPQKLGFHNLRHTFVTQLKVSGAMDSIAKELAGHGSDAVSAVYTHLPAETLTHAVNQLPEFVK